jgi:hypothetical protein
MSPSDMLKLNESQRLKFESWLRDVQLDAEVYALVPAEQIEAAGHQLKENGNG